MRQLQRERNPVINFWIDNEPVRFYYGVPTLDRIPTTGIKARWVKLYLEPKSAVGEYVLVIDIPRRWLMSHMDARLGGNKKLMRERLLDKNLYTKWKKSDAEYYAGAEIRIATWVPSRYIVGFIKK